MYTAPPSTLVGDINGKMQSDKYILFIGVTGEKILMPRPGIKSRPSA